MPEEKETPSNALVIVTKSTNACFSDLVRVTGFFGAAPGSGGRRPTRKGSKVIDLLVREGDIVGENQELARLTPRRAPRNSQPRAAPISLRAPAAGLVTASQHHRRRSRFAAGRTDVPHRRQQRSRTRRRSARRPHDEAQSGRDGADQPR